MSKCKWIAVAVFALVTICPSVKAQCSPNPCYTINPPVYVHLTPAQAAAQGASTMTLNATATSDPNGVNPLPNAVGSHVLTVVPNTGVGLSWSSSNGGTGATVHAYLSINGVQHDEGLYPLNGTGHWFMGSGDIGHPYVMVLILTNQYGQITTDRITVNTVDGSTLSPPVAGPAFTYQDQRPNNDYAQFNTSGGGGSMLADFLECQGANQRQCINATHTPYSQVFVGNNNTNDSLFHPKHIAGNIAKANESVSYGDSLCCLAVLPDDVITFNEDDEVDCSVAGPVPPAPKHKDVQFGMKITYSWVSALVKSNGWHPEAAYCSPESSKPDWPGPFEASPSTKSGEYAGAEEMYREVDAGQSFVGVPWSWWFSYISQPYIYPTDPTPPNCTNTDKGFKNGVNVFWPLPGLPF